MQCVDRGTQHPLRVEVFAYPLPGRIKGVGESTDAPPLPPAGRHVKRQRLSLELLPGIIRTRRYGQ